MEVPEPRRPARVTSRGRRPAEGEKGAFPKAGAVPSSDLVACMSIVLPLATSPPVASAVTCPGSPSPLAAQGHVTVTSPPPHPTLCGLVSGSP